jgi:hypothetical protein
MRVLYEPKLLALRRVAIIKTTDMLCRQVHPIFSSSCIAYSIAIDSSYMRVHVLIQAPMTTHLGLGNICRAEAARNTDQCVAVAAGQDRRFTPAPVGAVVLGTK